MLRLDDFFFLCVWGGFFFGWLGFFLDGLGFFSDIRRVETWYTMPRKHLSLTSLFTERLVERKLLQEVLQWMWQL